MRVWPLFTHGNVCPRCGRYSERVRTPLVLRPVRLAFSSVQRRTCSGCRWHGFAFPQPARATGNTLSPRA
jgi:hypothetical protein